MTVLSVIVPLAVVFLIAIVAVPSQSFFFRRAERRRKEEEVQERNRSELVAERKRADLEKQLALQDSIGDEIVRAWVHAWKQAGRPPDRKIFVARRSFGQDPIDASYYIEVGRNSDPLTTKLWMNTDLRLKGKEFSLTGIRKFLGGHTNHTTIGLEGGVGFVKNTLVRHIFPEAFVS